MNETIIYNEVMTDAAVFEFMQDWFLQIVIAISVFYLIKQSRQRKRTEMMTMIKVESIAYALGKTTVGDDFTRHYEAEVEKRMEQQKFQDP